MDGIVSIYLARVPQYQDKYRKYRVLLDDRESESIAQDQTLKFQVTPGEHSVKIEIDWTSSNTLVFNARPEQDIYLECGSKAGANPVKMFLALTIVRNSYLYVKLTR